MPIEDKKYKQVDPRELFKALSGMPYRDWIADLPSYPEASRAFYDKYGYMVSGPQGVFISAHSWSKNLGSDANDYDLCITVFYGISAKVVKKVMSEHGTPSSECVGSVFPNANEILINESKNVPFLYARYGNYLLAIVAQISESRLFSSREELNRLLKELDANVLSVLSDS